MKIKVNLSNEIIIHLLNSLLLFICSRNHLEMYLTRFTCQGPLAVQFSDMRRLHREDSLVPGGDIRSAAVLARLASSETVGLLLARSRHPAAYV